MSNLTLLVQIIVAEGNLVVHDKYLRQGSHGTVRGFCQVLPHRPCHWERTAWQHPHRGWQCQIPRTVEIALFLRCFYYLDSLVAKASDWWLSGREFEPRLPCCRVTTLGKLFTPVCLCHQAVNLALPDGRWRCLAGKVTAGLAESNGSLPPGGWLRADCLFNGIISGPNSR